MAILEYDVHVSLDADKGLAWEIPKRRLLTMIADHIDERQDGRSTGDATRHVRVLRLAIDRPASPITAGGSVMYFYGDRFTHKNKKNFVFVGGLWPHGHELFPDGVSGAFVTKESDALGIAVYWETKGAVLTEIINTAKEMYNK